MARKKPNMRAVWLGQSLREIRNSAGLTSKEAGRYLYRDGTSITRMEMGEIPLSVEMLDLFMDMCSITDPHKRADLQTIRRDVGQAGWWDGYRGDAVVSTLMDRAWIESKATWIRTFDFVALPGLLQTPEYAEALMRARQPGATDEQMRRWVDLRMTRQHVLSRHKRLRFSAIIEGNLLRGLLGHPETMKSQLDYLLEVWDRPDIDIRVLPAGSCTGLGGSFELIELADPYPEVAYLGTSAGELCVEGHEVESLSEAYDRLLDASLDSKASKRLITAERDKL